MSEQGKDFSAELDLPVLMDPVIERVLAVARDFQHDMDTASSDDLPTIASLATSELNGRWRLFMHSPVKVNGQVRSPIVDARKFRTEGQSMFMLPFVMADERNLLVTDYQVTDQQCASLGFGLEEENLSIDGEVIGTRPVIKLVFRRMVYVNCYDEDDPDQVGLARRAMDMVADIGAVTLKFPLESAEFSRIKAQEYFERNVTSLNHLWVSDCKPTEKLIALRHETVRLPEVPGHDDIAVDCVTALERYANCVIGWPQDDTDCVADLSAGACLFNERTGELLRIGLDGSNPRLVRLFGVRLRPKVVVAIDAAGLSTKPSDAEMEYRVVAKFLRETPDQDSPPLEIRLNDIINIESVRDFHNA